MAISGTNNENNHETVRREPKRAKKKSTVDDFELAMKLLERLDEFQKITPEQAVAMAPIYHGMHSQDGLELVEAKLCGFIEQGLWSERSPSKQVQLDLDVAVSVIIIAHECRMERLIKNCIEYLAEQFGEHWQHAPLFGRGRGLFSRDHIQELHPFIRRHPECLDMFLGTAPNPEKSDFVDLCYRKLQSQVKLFEMEGVKVELEIEEEGGEKNVRTYLMLDDEEDFQPPVLVTHDYYENRRELPVHFGIARMFQIDEAYSREHTLVCERFDWVLEVCWGVSDDYNRMKPFVFVAPHSHDKAYPPESVESWKLIEKPEEEASPIRLVSIKH